MTILHHREYETVLDLLSQLDRTMNQIMYDEADPLVGIEDSERSEQLHSDRDMLNRRIDLLITAPTDLVICEDDWYHDTTCVVIDIDQEVLA